MFLRALLLLALLVPSALSLNLLLLGGNGLIGGHTTRRLMKAGHRLTALNRGSLLWDWKTELAGHFDKKLQCNRVDPLSSCEDFQALVATRPFFDVVLDFSGFEQHMIDSTVPALKFMFDRYVFISTDSVYEVARTKNHTGPWLEEDAVRPNSMEERRKLEDKDRYAEMKLRCEEQLTGYAKKFNFSAIFLRLPDVVGPRDSTLRLWSYMAVTEIAAMEQQTLQLPAFAKDWPISFVYADDVARALVQLVNYGASQDAWPTPGQSRAFNFANPETMTLNGLLTRLMELMRLSVRTNTVKDPYAERPGYLFPSVKNGPVDVTKVRRTLNFGFTAWDTALRATVKFYKQRHEDLKQGRGLELLQRLHDQVDYLAMLPHFDEKIWMRFVGRGQGRTEL